MSKQKLTKDELFALSARRFEAVGSKDIEATMAVLVADPVFELFPANLRLSGQDNVRRYYENFFASASADISGDVVDAYVSDNAVCLEMQMQHTRGAGVAKQSRMIAIQPTEGNLFTGERLFGDEQLFRLMFPEPIWSLFEPIEQ